MSHSKTTMLPKYSGEDEFLKESISNVPMYFCTTKVSEWCLEGFMLETGKDATNFVEYLKCLSRVKRLPLALVTHANALRRHYGGPLSVEKVRLAEVNAKRTITDHVLHAKQHLQVQRSVENCFEEQADPALHRISPPVCEETDNFTVTADSTKTASSTKLKKTFIGGKKGAATIVSVRAGQKHSCDSSEDVLAKIPRHKGASHRAAAEPGVNTENVELESFISELMDERHPFFGLFQALYDIHHERPHIVPSVPANLSDIQKGLFRFVRSKLNKFTTLDRVAKKDVYVAASMIAHLEMDDAEDYFGGDLIQQLHSRIFDADFAKPKKWLVDVLMEIQEETKDRRYGINAARAKHLAVWRLGLLSRDELDGKPVDHDLVCALEIVKLMSKICEPPIVQRPKETESMTVKVWHELFDILFTGTIITIVTGESGLSASREERESSELDHCGVNPPLSPRKVDFVLKASVEHLRKVTHVELADYEHKSPAATEEDVAVQLRKSMRHNQAILARLPKLEEVVFLDIHGYSARIMKMISYDGAHVCSEMSEEIILPTNSFELQCFFAGNGLAALMNLRDIVLKAAMDVQQHLQKPKQPTLARTVTPPRKGQVRTFYTPTSRKS